MRKTGKNLLSDPLFNKGLGFPRTERDRLGIRGLVPPSTYVIKISTRNFENISFKSKYDSCCVCGDRSSCGKNVASVVF